jgi:DNA-binding Lrp family transcriptional regulator
MIQTDTAPQTETDLDDLEKRLLDTYQHGLPLSPTPYADMGKVLDASEQEVIEALQRLQASSTISRVGAVFKPNRIGVSTLAAMSVPAEQLESVAQRVNQYPEVNHNYEREHAFNLWFVVTAANPGQLEKVLNSIECQTGLTVMSLPLVEDYHIDLGFPLQWGEAYQDGSTGGMDI